MKIFARVNKHIFDKIGLFCKYFKIENSILKKIHKKVGVICFRFPKFRFYNYSKIKVPDKNWQRLQFVLNIRQSIVFFNYFQINMLIIVYFWSVLYLKIQIPILNRVLLRFLQNCKAFWRILIIFPRLFEEKRDFSLTTWKK